MKNLKTFSYTGWLYMLNSDGLWTSAIINIAFTYIIFMTLGFFLPLLSFFCLFSSLTLTTLQTSITFSTFMVNFYIYELLGLCGIYCPHYIIDTQKQLMTLYDLPIFSNFMTVFTLCSLWAFVVLWPPLYSWPFSPFWYLLP